MNTTTAKILKILFQSEISIDEMYLYLDVEKSAIVKSIGQINEFLESISLNKIEKENNNYRLTLEKEEWDYLYSKYDVLTFEDKVDYLYVKFISKGFINLEKEKDILDVSRSTILRCFKAIKDEFQKNGSEYEYIHGKGLKLKCVSEREKIKFNKKLMKFFIEEDMLIKPLKDLLNDLKKFDSKSRITQLYYILRESGVSINYFVFSFLCSLEIYLNIFGKLDFSVQKYFKTERWEEISKIVDKYGDDFRDDYKEQVISYIISVLNEGTELDIYLKEKSQRFVTALLDCLNVKRADGILQKMLFYRVYNSFLKYENNILKIKKIELNSNQKFILDRLNCILKENSYDMYYSDKFSIIQIIRKIIVEHNLKEVKNVLLLFNEATLIDQDLFGKKLKKVMPHIKFYIEATYFHKKNNFLENKEYDLIISDEFVSKDVLVVDDFCCMKIQELIEKKMFEIGLSKINGVEDESYKYI